MSFGPEGGLMFSRATWQVFLAGALSGAVLTAGTGALFVWWKPAPQRTAEEEVLYDRCLLAQRGNTVACDALLRVIEHEMIAANGGLRHVAYPQYVQT